MDQQAPSAIVQRYWDGLWNRRDLSVIDELIAEPYVRHSSTGTRSLTRDQFRQVVRESWQLLRDPATTVDDQVTAEDRVWTRATTTGLNFETGQTSVVTWLVVHRVADGRIAESWSATLPGVDWR